MDNKRVGAPPRTIDGPGLLCLVLIGAVIVPSQLSRDPEDLEVHTAHPATKYDTTYDE